MCSFFRFLFVDMFEAANAVAATAASLSRCHRFDQLQQETALENLFEDSTAPVLASGNYSPVAVSPSTSLFLAGGHLSPPAPTTPSTTSAAASGAVPVVAPAWLGQLGFLDAATMAAPMSRLLYALYRPPLSFSRRCLPLARSLLTYHDPLYVNLTKQRGGGLGLKRTSSASLPRIERNHPVVQLAPHPTLPLYVSGTAKGELHVWHFGLPHVLRVFAPQGTTLNRLTRLRFSANGARVVAAGLNGSVVLFAFTPDVEDGWLPFLNWKAHGRACHDVCFIQGGSVLVTVGDAADNKNVCLWDTLKTATGMLSRPMLLKSIECHAEGGGATAVAVVPRQRRLVVGSATGGLCVVDLDTNRVVHMVEGAHGGSVLSVLYDATRELLVTGGTEGDVKCWALTSKGLVARNTMENVYEKKRFFNLPEGASYLEYVVTVRDRERRRG
jgi:hypothetical protein